MRISLITETYFPQVNGVSRTLGQLVRVLQEAGDTVQVIHPDYGEPAGDPDRHLVRSLNLPFYRELFLPLPPFGNVRRALDAFRPDIVHVATEATLGLVGLRHALKRKMPVVSSFHTNFDQYAAHYRARWATGTVWRYLRWFHNRTLETYVPSLATIGMLEPKGFRRLVLWPRGVDSTVFRPDRPGRDEVRRALGLGPDDVVIGHVGRLAPEKNLGFLAAALRAAVERRPGLKVLIVGDGPSRRGLEAQLGASAHFAGYRSGQDLADHYAAADVFAFASLTETFGNVVLEAMASGLPVVAVKAGGPGEVVRDGSTGRLIGPDESPDRMADALVALADGATLRRRMSEEARAYAEGQSWDAIMGQLRSRYRAIVEQGAPLPATTA